jgi:hypothetical protein
VTAGDIFEYTPRDQATRAETEMKNDYMAQAFGLMSYDAIGIGEKDLAQGVDFVKQLAAKYELPLVCSNAIRSDTKELIFDPYIIGEKDGVRVAFLAVVSPERHIVAQVESELLDKKIEFLDPTTQIQKFLPEVRQKADVVVLLSHCGIETSKFLATDLDLDVVMVGHYPAVLNSPEEHGGTIFAMAGSKSDRFGTLEITLSADNKDIVASQGDAILALKSGPEVPEIFALFEAMDAKDKEAKRERQLAAQRERDMLAQDKATGDIHKRGGVMGAESCKGCHQPVYDRWMETPHATAFATLAEADAWDNPDCVGCHVTGVEDKNFVADVNLPPEVWNVQCEECHGSGLEHARDGSYVTHGETTCRKCHDPDNSPEFDFTLYSSYGVH